MKWIKASERLPEGINKKRVHIKINGKPEYMVYIISFGESIGKWCWSLAFNDSKGMHISGEEINQIEWLDESPSPVGAGTGYTREQIIKAIKDAIHYANKGIDYENGESDGAVIELILSTLTHADQKGEGWISDDRTDEDIIDDMKLDDKNYQH